MSCSSTHVYYCFCIFFRMNRIRSAYFLNFIISHLLFSQKNGELMFKEKLKNFFYLVVVVFSAWSITFNIFWLAMNECPRIPVKNSRSTFFLFFFLNNASFVSFFLSALARKYVTANTHMIHNS